MPQELTEIRHSIDNIDAALIHLLAERFTYTQRVGRLKARYGLPPADPAREAVQIERLRRLAESARLDPAFAEKFLGFVVEEVIRHHRAIAEEDAAGDAGDPVSEGEPAPGRIGPQEGSPAPRKSADLGN
nr:chorismate mutase [Gephyromycinifex aptenodytis]